MASCFVLGVECREAPGIEPAVDAGNRLRERLARPYDAVAQEAASQGEQQRPLAQACRKRSQCQMLGLRLIVWQPLREEGERFPGPHRVDHHAKGVRRQHVVEARRDQARRVAAALQERPQILLAPHVVDDKEAAPLGQSIGELGARGADGLQA
jgi:hypothetical protein